MSKLYSAVEPLAHAWTKFFIWSYPRGLGLLAGHAYLLLETKGRRTGVTRVTPLGYVRWGSHFLVQPLHGAGSSWVRNLLACPRVEVMVGLGRLSCTARVMDDVAERLDALRVIGASRTVSGLTARRYFSLLGKADEDRLGRASHDLDKLVVLLETDPIDNPGRR